MLDDNTVIHYASKTNNMFAKDQAIRISSIDEFSNNRIIYKEKLYDTIDLGVLYERVQKFDNSGKKYNFITNNCFSFVFTCLNGSTTVVDTLKNIFKYRIQPFAFILH